MKEFFAIDGPFMSFFSKAWDLIVLSIIATIFSIPVVTIGVTISALYFTIYKRFKKEETRVVRTFLRAFIANLKQGLLIGVVLEIFIAVVLFSIYFIIMSRMGTIGMVFGILFFLLLGLLFMMMAFCLPLASRFENSCIEISGNAVSLAFSNFRVAMAMGLLQGFYLAGLFGTFVIPFFILFVPGFFMWMQYGMLEPILAPYLPEEIEDEEYILTMDDSDLDEDSNEELQDREED